ncbi:MAG: hypothetical protein JXX14_20080 [Deltaproteobacteria bacterium]|nr:hypothetical protein [Deltaproteobacteria bacterium]
MSDTAMHSAMHLMQGRAAPILLFAISVLFLAGRECVAQMEGMADSHQTTERDAQPLRIVVVSRESDPADGAAIEASIEAQLADLAVESIFIRDIPLPTDDAALDELAGQLMLSHGARAAFVVSPTSGLSLRILLSVDGRNASMARTVDVARGMPLHEAFAVIVRSTMVAILETERRKADEQSIAASQAQREKAQKRKSSASSGRSEKARVLRERSDGGVFFDSGVALELVARNKGIVPGLVLGVGWRFSRNWQIQMGAVLFSTVDATLNRTRVAIKRYPVYWGAGYYIRLGRFEAGGGGGVRLDFIREQVSTMNPDVSLGENYAGNSGDNIDTHLSLYVTGRAAWWISRFLCVHLDMGAALMLKSTGYCVNAGDECQAVMATRPVQMLMIMGAQIHFF